MSYLSDGIPLGLSYDDVLLIPQYSEIKSRSEINITGQLTRNIQLQVPVLSANMLSTTTTEMAIAMAEAGGMGILHRFLSIEDNAQMVRDVKRYRNLIINDPYTIQADRSVEEAHKMMKRYRVSGLLVIDAANKLMGICTHRDMRSAHSYQQRVEDIMTPRSKLVTGDVGISNEQARLLMANARVEKLPLVDAENNLLALITMKDIQQASVHPLGTVDERGQLRVGGAVGVKNEDIDRAHALVEAGVDVLCLDIAHGHSKAAIDMVRYIKANLPVDIIAGNVATGEGVKDLVKAGADCVKVHVGPGSTCITRMVAGVGVPTLSAVLDCATAAKDAGVPICADGGIKRGGDVAKAIGAGANTVMVGNKLAAAKESPGEIIHRASGGLYKRHFGMASKAAVDTRRGLDNKKTVKTEKVVGELGFGEDGGHTPPPEGVESFVPYDNKTVADILGELSGGLRSGMSYSNSRSITEFHQKAKFIRITPAGLTESLPHDVEF